MNSLPLSFIVPVYNVEAYLDECLASLVQASQPGDEILLVEDGSTDRSPALCEAWVARHPALLRLVRQANAGLSAARNAGLRASRHEHVLFFDSDDVLLHPAMASARSMLAELNPDVLVCDYAWWFSGTSRPDFRPPLRSHAPARLLSDARVFTHETLQDFLLSACCRIFRRDLLLRDGATPFPVGATFEDVTAIPQLTLRAATLAYLPQVLFRYRVRDGSITQSRSARQCRDRCRALLPFLQTLGSEAGDDPLLLVTNMRLAQQWTMAIRDCGLMQPQQPDLYQELIDTMLQALTLPVKSVVRGLRGSTISELRRTAAHLAFAYRWPTFYIGLRRIVYGRQRMRQQRRTAARTSSAT